MWNMKEVIIQRLQKVQAGFKGKKAFIGSFVLFLIIFWLFVWCWSVDDPDLNFFILPSDVSEWLESVDYLHVIVEVS